MAATSIDHFDDKAQEKLINTMRLALEDLRASQPEIVERVLAGSSLNIATLKFEQKLAAYRAVFEALVGQGVLNDFDAGVDESTNDLIQRVGEA